MGVFLPFGWNFQKFLSCEFKSSQQDSTALHSSFVFNNPDVWKEWHKILINDNINVILSYSFVILSHYFTKWNYIPHIVLHLPNSAGLQVHIPTSKMEARSTIIIINHNPARMEDGSNSPTKPTSSKTIHHANPFTKLIQDINLKSNVKKSRNYSLFCNGFLAHSTTAV